MKNSIILQLAATVIVGVASSNAATIYNVDWGDGGDAVKVFSGAAAIGDTVGLPTDDVWNKIDPETGSDFRNNIMDSTGAMSVVSVSWTPGYGGADVPNNFDFSTSGPGGTSLDDLMEDYGFTNGPESITISGLDADLDYTLYLFGHGDGFGQTTSFDVAGGTAQTVTSLPGGNNRDDNNGFAAGVDYAVFTGSTGAGGSITYTQGEGGGGFTGSGGFQLEVIPEPSSLSLLGLVGLLAFRRRRR